LREPLTIKLLWATVACMLLTLLPEAVQLRLVQWPLVLSAAQDGDAMAVLGNFMPWQLATHVLVNSLMGLILAVAPVLWFFGSQLEGMWGSRRYGLFLIACVLGAALVVLAITSTTLWLGLTGPVIASGDSGFTYGILFALAYITPYQEVRLMLPSVSMQMRTMAIVFSVINFVVGVTRQGLWVEVGFLLGGILAAWLHIRYWRGLPPFRRKPPAAPKKKNHLRSV
jgi:membrane associated rhomboid family serine protease